MTEQKTPGPEGTEGHDQNTTSPGGEPIMNDATDETAGFPATPKPKWATGRDDTSVDADGNLSRQWYANIVNQPNFDADMGRLDSVSPSGKVSKGDVVLDVYIDRNEPITFVEPDHVREAAANLLAAADAFEKALGKRRAGRVS